MKVTVRPRSTPKRQRTRVLIVDDDADGAEIAATLLAIWGHETRWVTSGDEALRQAVAFRPHLAVIDLQMPDVSGYEVARQVRALEGPPPYLAALSGLGTPAVHAAAMAAGFDEHVLKPANAAVLRSIVRIAERRAQREGTLPRARR